MQRNCTHATNPPKPLPSTSPGTRPAPTVPHAVPQHVSGYETQEKRSRARANTEPHPCNETAPMQRIHLTAPQHVPGHATVPSAPSTSPGTKPSPTVPHAVLQHMRGYETQGKRSPPRAGERNHTQKRKPRPLRRVKRHKRIKPYPCNETTKTSPQHVPGHEPGPNRFPRRAAARGRPRFTRKTFPAAC